MPFHRKRSKKSCIVIGTGPSLEVERIRELQPDIALFGVNNTYNDFHLDHWIACDPQWHTYYGKVEGDFDKWHWNKDTCTRNGYNYIEGRWGKGLSLDPSYIHYGHCSGFQALNLAVHYGYEKIYLVGHDFHDITENRHYFNDLSDIDGEYPATIRKYSSFAGLLKTYSYIGEQSGLPEIVNCNPNSALKTFPFEDLP